MKLQGGRDASRPPLPHEVEDTKMPAIEWNDFHTERINTGAANLAVRIGGSGPPLVLLHGFPQHSLMWRRVAPLLTDTFTVIVPDQRGMGASSLPDGMATKTDLAADLAKVLDHLGHLEANFAGYDLGAGAAVAFARDNPQRVRRLAVMEFVLAGFGLEEAMAPKAGWNAASNWHFSVFAAPDVAVWLFTGRERELLDWFFWHGSHLGSGAVSSDDLDAYARALSRPGALRAGASFYASIFADAQDNASLKADPLAMPVLAMGGASYAGPRMQALWQDVARDLRTVMIPNAGHWLADENPDATATALRDFFDPHQLAPIGEVS
jgi:pimeloyl-ACP methyl ester carboxylesterase